MKAVHALALVSFVATPAFSQVYIDGSDISDVINAARGFGSAFLEPDDTNPIIHGRMDGHSYTGYFHDCSSGSSCDNFLLQAYWGEPNPNYDDLNEWNFQERWTKVYASEEDGVVLEMDVDLSGGISLAVLESAFGHWRTALEAFSDFMVAGSSDDEAHNDGSTSEAASDSSVGDDVTPDEAGIDEERDSSSEETAGAGASATGSDANAE